MGERLLPSRCVKQSRLGPLTVQEAAGIQRGPSQQNLGRAPNEPLGEETLTLLAPLGLQKP